MTQQNQGPDDTRATNRRNFLKMSAVAGLGAVAVGKAQADLPGRLKPAPMREYTNEPMERVRMAFVGVGAQGGGHVRNFLRMPEVEVVAVCDIRPERAERVRDWCVEGDRPEPTLYTRGEWDFVRLSENEDVDLIFNATPWRWHVPGCIAAMENGKHAAVEVPASITTEGCWQLVEAAEKYQKHCVMMENCCYDYVELMILNMVRKGLFGEIIHAEGAYNHDLRGVKFNMGYEGVWRRAHSQTRNGNLYPTHGLGPVAQCLNINRGDQLDYIVAMSSNSRGLQNWARDHYPEDHPFRSETYVLGDVHVDLIKTKLGRTITLIHDTNLPRPYSRAIMMQGTRGIARKYPDPKIHIEGRSPGHGWEDFDTYKEEFEHPLWAAIQEKAAGAGHGGMDFIEDYRLIQCLLKGEPMDMDVYDAAAWSVICETSEQSVAKRSGPIDIPDFTRGRWVTRKPLGIIEG